MKPNPEKRESSRLPYQSTVMFEDRTTGHYYYATMYSFSGDGMYCRSDVALRPGASINIKIDNMFFKSAPNNYFGKVRWCEKMNGNDNSHSYELGIKIINAIYD
jgi:hypothetical protein